MSGPARRTRERLVVLAFLAAQLGLPLSYYLGDRVYDERFAWRMFSPIRMVRCRPQLSDGGEPIALDAHFAAPWITWMKRGHADVLLAAGERLCAERGPGAAIRADLSCRLPDGRTDVLLDGELLCP